jgi:hypothetical protein
MRRATHLDIDAIDIEAGGSTFGRPLVLGPAPQSQDRAQWLARDCASRSQSLSKPHE